MKQKIVIAIDSFWPRFKIEIIIFCLVFGVRVLYALLVWILYDPSVFTAYSDAESFVTVAHNLLAHSAFSQIMEGSLYYPDSIRTPGYPFFLALFFLFKAPPVVVVIVQHILAGFLGVMLYRLSLMFFKSRFVGLFAAIIFAIEPASIYWNNLLMSDNLFTFFLFFALYLFCRQKFFWFAFIFGLAILTRPIGLYFFPLFLIMFVIEYMRGSYNILITVRRVVSRVFFWKTLFVLISLTLLIMSPWMIRNKLVFDTWEFSSAGWVNLYLFTASPYAKEHNIFLQTLQMPIDYPIQNSVIFSYDFRNIPFYRGQIFGLFYQHPVSYAAFHVISAVKGLGNTGYKYLIDNVIGVKFSSIPSNVLVLLFYIGQGFWSVLMLLVFFGFWRKETRLRQIFLFSFFAVNTLLLGNSASGQGGRYHLPIEPIILLLAGNGVVVAFAMIKMIGQKTKCFGCSNK